jgi:hypothetical protein
VSKTVYNGFDTKLKVLSTERSAINTGAQSNESGAIRNRNGASSVGHRVICDGAGLRVEHGAIRDTAQGAKCQSTEQSVDRHGGPSVEHGAIRERREAGSGGHGAIHERCETRGIVCGAIRRRCRVPSAERRSNPWCGVTRKPARAPSDGSGAICKRRKELSVESRVKSAISTGLTRRSAEQSA